MKTQIAKMLRKMAQRISPETGMRSIEFNIKPVVLPIEMNMRKLAVGYEIRQEDVMQEIYKFSNKQTVLSQDQALDRIIQRKKREIREGIIMAIDKYDLIEYQTSRERGVSMVSGYMYVFQKKED